MLETCWRIVLGVMRIEEYLHASELAEPGYFVPYLIKFFCQYFLLITFKPYFCAGGMSERFNEAVLKTVDPKGPGVRIPLSPLNGVSNILKGS